MADHVHTNSHPQDPEYNYLYIVAIEDVRREEQLLSREIYWQANLGSLFTGLNQRKDLNAALKQRINY